MGSGEEAALPVGGVGTGGGRASFIAYGIPLAPVTSFRYLGIILLEEEVNWLAVFRNLQKSWREWASLTRVLSREGGMPEPQARYAWRWFSRSYCTGQISG